MRESERRALLVEFSDSDLKRHSFSISRKLCELVDAADPDGSEMLLRALEHYEDFGESRRIIDALIRKIGLFPYLDQGSLSIRDAIAYEFHKPENLRDVVFHGPQAQVYRRLMAGENVILSAPTSFGKSLIIDGVIASDRFRNIIIIVPTIALLDETRRRLVKRFPRFKCLTRLTQSRGERNIFILTQERALQEPSVENVDFFVIDEFYKLNPSASDFDDERCIILNQVFYRLARTGAQFYLLGPSIQSVAPGVRERLSYSFIHETYQTVVSELHHVTSGANDIATLTRLCASLHEPTIIFCSSPARTATVAKALIEADLGRNSGEVSLAAEWVSDHYHPDWTFCKALVAGIGIHHARIPRSLGQYVVRAFEDGQIRFLVCTSTLIEGVNTKAKNIIVLDHQIQRKAIDFFTFNNIRGRSGRMFSHFVGRVYLFHPEPSPGLPIVDVPAFSQSEAAVDGLLVQLEEDDLSDRSRNRVNNLREQRLLSFETIRAHPGVDPGKLLQLAREISGNLRPYARLLNWRGFPSYEQLQLASNLIWNTFGGRKLGSGSARTPEQLAKMLRILQGRPSVREFIAGQIAFAGRGGSLRPDIDEEVQRVLDFVRLWAMFHFPRLLRVLDSVQREILVGGGYAAGDYESYASQVECLFLDPAIVALDEYGVPMEIARKLEQVIDAQSDLDRALTRLKELDLSKLSLRPFEVSLVAACQEFL